jgi:UDP-N-acetylmuramoylalanine--D-glutamate ligase
MLNMLCAAGITHMRGVPFETIVEAFTTFVGLPHRFESLGVAAGVHFIDDSKATNAHAAMAGLKGLEEPFVAIVGGVDKGLDLGAFCQHLAGHASAVISIGELRGRLATELADAGFDSAKLHEAESMEEAVEKAHRVAGHGGTVVLSPACSSFDMFRSYAHRGEVFQQAVARLRATEVGE